MKKYNMICDMRVLDACNDWTFAIVSGRYFVIHHRCVMVPVVVVVVEVMETMTRAR